MPPDYPPPGAPAWRLVLQETAAFMAAALLYPFGVRRRRYLPTPRQREQRTVVLVHGLLCNPSVFMPMSAYLKRRGIKQVMSYGYASTKGIEHAAIGLRQFLKENVRGGEIDFVCHSMGGIVARSYVQELGGARRTNQCITLGTPHLGTYNAYWLLGKAGEELRPGSVLLQRLHATRDACTGVRFRSIVGGADNLVIPRIHAAHEESVCVPDTGHMAMMFSPQVWGLVGDYLLGTETVAEPCGQEASNCLPQIRVFA